MASYKDVLILVDKVSAPLKKIVNTMQQTTEKTNKLTDKLGRLNQKMKTLAPTSLKVLQLTGKLTKAFLGLVGASGVITAGINKVADYGDRIDKLSQKIGMSSKAFQEWDYIMSINGGEVETLQQGFKTLVTQIEGVQKGSKDSVNAFRALGVQVKDNNGQFRKADDVFNDVIRKLQQTKDPTQKMILANRLFGRSASELRPLLNQEAQAVDDLREKANKMGLIMSEEDIQNAVRFKDTMNTLGRFFQANMNKALVQILPKLTEIMNKIIELKEPLMAIIKFLGTIAVVTLKVFGFLAKHWEILVGIGTALGIICGPAILAGIGAIIAGFTALNFPLIAIGVAIGAIITAIVALVRNWKKVWATIKQVTTNVISGILNFINKLLDKLGWLAYLIPGLREIKIGKDIAGAISSKMNNNNVRQTQNNTTNNNSVTNNNYYGNSGSTNMTPVLSGVYAVGL